MPDRIPRRTVLAGLVGGVSITTASVALTTDRSQSFTRTTAIATDSVDGLVADWRETYNGATLTPLDDSDGTASSSEPGISVGNVLPGDSGSLSVRLRLESEDSSLAVVPSMAFDLASGESSPLQAFINGSVWYDGGLLGISAFGGDNGEQDLGESLVHPEADGTLEDLAAVFRDGIDLTGTPERLGGRCLESGGDGVTVTFGWSFPPDQPNINAAQGDSLEFDLSFDATQC
ncbi:hypothetical protein G6M89_17285 [Natronolimnobius sp. AArcel1]|uniref:hypothetical protein n=1 Tax=Natronolimnobius sp. AArcel1 TaxID=1679093 RepID=UPI0013EA9C23|nr:hypothetical protein [Natronolimnobius sp. AArcel1]NGM70738.1 hypothetical protein [Natronolimnobius sp. AArcel1]